jgi:hypothetical protein
MMPLPLLVLLLSSLLQVLVRLARRVLLLLMLLLLALVVLVLLWALLLIPVLAALVVLVMTAGAAPHAAIRWRCPRRRARCGATGRGRTRRRTPETEHIVPFVRWLQFGVCSPLLVGQGVGGWW